MHLPLCAPELKQRSFHACRDCICCRTARGLPVCRCRLASVVQAIWHANSAVDRRLSCACNLLGFSFLLTADRADHPGEKQS
jgi:hypothetical protein